MEVGTSDDPSSDDRQPPISTEGPAAASQALDAAARFWWISVLRGAISLLLGLSALVAETSTQSLINFIAAYWVLSGLLTIKWALGVRWRKGARLGLAAGFLALGTGALLLVRQLLVDVVSPRTLINVVALATVATGCLRLVGAFEVEKHSSHRWTLGGVMLGSVEVTLGLVLLFVADAESSTLRLVIGIWGLSAGGLLLAQGARMFQVRRSVSVAQPH